MALRLYDTLTRGKVDFRPLDPERVRLYVCGPTVYDRAHIGNARPVIVFDVLFRLLRHLYGAEHVVYARNITDIDDKIIARAAERGVSIRDLTDGTARGFAEDVAALGCLVPTVEPRATEHVAEMIEVTRRLVAAGHAYAPDDPAGAGHVLFSVASMADYGKLSHRTLDEMMAGARIEVAPYKRADGDFVLWKPSSDDEPGWDSPWGRGRPGWHLECSAMTWKHLGEQFDIHGGGIDLVFPHHENELAQSCCAFDRPFMAQIWMHNGFLQVEHQKMSKSLGNFVTIRDLVAGDTFGGRSWPGEVLRLAMLRTHYRQPIDWTVKALEEAERTLDRWYDLAEGVDVPDSPTDAFLDDLGDDLNTPAAIAALHTAFAAAGDKVRGRAIASARVLGLLQHDTAAWRGLRQGEAGVDAAWVDARIAARLAARRERNWAESDRIRDELASAGIVLKDNKDGTTTWTVARKGAA